MSLTNMLVPHASYGFHADSCSNALKEKPSTSQHSCPSTSCTMVATDVEEGGHIGNCAQTGEDVDEGDGGAQS